MVGGLFLSWTRPSADQKKSCLASSPDDSFNYDPSFFGATNQLAHRQEKIDEGLRDAGFFINRSRALLGSGADTFHLAKSALLCWKHFELGWAFVDPTTTVEKGNKFCVCVKELVPWIMMPLQIAYVDDETRARAANARFGFAGGTLRGHLLAGEERFAVELDENDRVWYEILSFSKAAHVLSFIGYPYVKLRQKFFAQQSTDALLKYIASQQPTN